MKQFTISAFRFMQLSYSIRRLEVPDSFTEGNLDFYNKSFGVTPYVTALTFHLLKKYKYVPENFQAKYLLWTLLFLKQYPSKTQFGALLGASDRNYNENIWFTIGSIAKLLPHVVSMS